MTFSFIDTRIFFHFSVWYSTTIKATDQIYYAYIILKFGKEVHLVKAKNGFSYY